jgi:hypothetical protein
MNRPLLTFSSKSADAFVRKLSGANIRVPRVGEGRTSQHRERYTMARFLATAYTQGLVDLPITVDHRDNTGNPDFLLSFGGFQIGAECVEVVPQEWYAIEAIRRREFPSSLTFFRRFEPREHLYSASQKRRIAAGSASGPGWVGNEPEQEWAEAHAYFVEDKVQKLRKGNYQPLTRVWLVMQDEWRVPVTTVDEKMLALSLLLPKLPVLLQAPSFERVFICSNPVMIEITATDSHVYPLDNWWHTVGARLGSNVRRSA